MATQKQLSPANLAFFLGSEIPSLDNMARVSQPFAMSGSGNIAFNMRAGTGTTGAEFIARIVDFYNSSVSKEAEQRARNAFGAGMISPEHPDADTFVGRAVCSKSGYIGNPALFLRRNAKAMGLQMPEALPDEAGCYSFIGKHIRGQAAKAHDEQQAYIRKVQDAQKQLMELGEDKWMSIISGNPVDSAKFYEIAGKLPASEGGLWLASMWRAQAAFRIIENYQKSGGKTDEKYLGINLRGNPSEEERRQESRTQTRVSLYNLPPDLYTSIHDSLSVKNDDGSSSMDERALNLFRFALNENMRGEQKIGGDFLARLFDGVREWGEKTLDFFAGDENPPWLPSPGSMSPEDVGKYQSDVKDWATLRKVIMDAESMGREVSDNASFLARAIGGMGNIAGQTAPATIAALATGGSGVLPYLAAASTIIPSAIQENTLNSVAEGYSNPYLTGAVQGTFEGLAEGVFSVIPGGGQFTKWMLRVGAKAPLLGRALAKAQSSSIARFFFGSSIETIGEAMEDTVSDFASNSAFTILRSLGVDISAPNVDIMRSLSQLADDPAQATAMVGFCFSMGLLGMPANAAKARFYASNYGNLRAALMSPEAAAEVSQRAQETAENIARVNARQDLTPEQKQESIDKLEDDWNNHAREVYRKDVMDAFVKDPTAMRKRAEAAKKEIMSQREAALLTNSGARDATLARMGIMSEPRPTSNGKYLLTFQTSDENGTPTETNVEWTEQQLTDWTRLQHNTDIAAAMRQYQEWLVAESIAKSPLAIENAEQAKTKLLNLGVAPTAAFNEAFADLARRGAIDSSFIEKLSRLADQEIRNFMASGMSAQEARQQPSAYIPGVATGTLANLRQDTRQRVASASQTTEGQTIGVTQENATFPAISIPTMDGGSVIAYVSGHVTPLQMAEDMWESKLKHDVAQGKYTWQQLEAQLKQAEAELKRVNPAISILPKKDTLTTQDIVEGYSTLQTADFITNHRHYPLSQDTHTLLDTAIRGAQATQAAALIGEAWKFASRGNIDENLYDLLQKAGMQMGSIINDAVSRARETMEELEARNFVPDVEQVVQDIVEQDAIEQREVEENPAEPAGTPQPIPADESVTGEDIPAEDPVTKAIYDPQTGEMFGWVNTDGEPYFKDRKYIDDGGFDVGVASVDSLQLADLPRLKPVAKLKGPWNPLAEPLHAFPQNGKLYVFSGTSRLEHAKRSGIKYISVKVHQAGRSKEDLVKFDALDNMMNGTATAEQVVVGMMAGREHGASYEKMESLGYIMKNKDGSLKAAMKLGVSVFEKARPDDLAKILQGKKSAREVAEDIARRESFKAMPQDEKVAAKTKNPQKWPKPNKEKLKEADTEKTFIDIVANTAESKDGSHYILKNVAHVFSNGREMYAATDGRRATLFSRDSEKPDAQILLKADGSKSNDEGHFPDVRHVIPASSYRTVETLDLSKIPSFPDKVDKKNVVVYLHFKDANGNGASVYVLASYLKDVIRQARKLAKVFGAPPAFKVASGGMSAKSTSGNAPVHFFAQFGKWKYDHVLMPLTPGENSAIVDVFTEEANAEPSALVSGNEPFASAALEVPTPTGPEFFKVPAGVSEEWIKKLDDFIKFKEHPNSPKKAKYHMRVCDTPPILLNLGLKPLGIWASSYAIWHPLALDHNMSQEEMEKLPECIYDPVMVLRSSTVKHSIVLLTEMTETKEDGRIEKALVPIHVERSARHSLDIAHRVASVYGKDGLKDWLFREIEKGNLLYVNKQKTREALNLDVALQLRLSADGRVISLGELNVPDENSIVNTKNTMRDIFPDIEDSSSDITLAISTAGASPADFFAQAERMRRSTLADRMMTHARAEANRFRRVLRKPTTDAEAAQDLASVLIFMETAMRYVPTARIPRMTAQRNALEAYIKMMQQGRIGVNRNGTIRRAGLTQEQIDAVAEQAAAAYEEAVARQDILPENKLTKEEAKKLQRDFIRAAARSNIGTTIADIYDDIASAIATALSDKLIDRMFSLMEKAAPVLTASRKPTKAKMGADAYREMGTIKRYMQMGYDEFEAAKDAYFAAMERGDMSEEAAYKAERDFRLLNTFGCINARTYGEVQFAYQSLLSFIATERHIWQDKLDDRMDAIHAIRDAFLDATDEKVGETSYLAEKERMEKSIGGRFLNSIKFTQNPAQVFLALSGIAPLKGVASRTMDAISRGNDLIRMAEHRQKYAPMAAYARIFGVNPEGPGGEYTDRQLSHLENSSYAQFAQDCQAVKKTGIIRKFQSRSSGKTIEAEIVANDFQIMNLLLTIEQDDYQGNAERWGYTQDVVDALEKHLGHRKLEYAHALRDALQDDTFVRCVEDREGIPMPDNPKYWPGRLNVSSQSSNLGSFDVVKSFTQHARYTNLRQRAKNDYDFAFASALDVYKNACSMRNNYIYMQPVTSQWRALLANNEFAARLKGTIGHTDFNIIKGFLDALDGATAAEGFMRSSVDALIAPFLSAYAVTRLALNPGTIIRQVDAVTHGAIMEGVGALDIIKEMLNMRQDKGRVSFREVMQLPGFVNRYSGSSAFDECVRKGENAKWSRFANWARLGMDAMQHVDIFFNAVSARALYNLTYERMEKERLAGNPSLTPESIKEYCEQQVTNMLELTAQPLRRTQKSAFVILNHNSIADACTFLGSEAINKVGFAYATYAKKYRETGSHAKAYLAFARVLAQVGVAGQLLQMLIDFMKGSTPGADDDKKDWLRYLGISFAKGVLGADILSDIPIVGQAFDFNAPVYGKGFDIPFIQDAQDAWKLVKMATDDRDHSASEYFNQSAKLTRDLAVTSSLLSSSGSETFTVLSGILDSAAAAANALQPFVKGIERGAIWSSDWLGLESKKQRQSRERRRKALLRTLSRPITTQHRFAF